MLSLGQNGYRLLASPVTASPSQGQWESSPAIKDAPMDVVHHSEIGTQHTTIEVMNQSAAVIDRKIRLSFLSIPSACDGHEEYTYW